MRSKTVKDWPVKGQTTDHGAGSRAKVLFAGLTDPQRIQVQDAYAKALEALKGLPTAVQRCIGFALASDWTLDAIVAKASEKSAVTVVKIDDEASARAKAEIGKETVSFDEYMGCFQKHKAAVQAERKAAKANAETAAS